MYKPWKGETMILTYTTDDLAQVVADLTAAIEANDTAEIERLADLGFALEALLAEEQAEQARNSAESRYEEYVAAGLPDDEAEAKATNRSLKSVRRERFKNWAHGEGFVGSDYRGLVTQAHDRQVEQDYYAAENSCRGHLLNNLGKRAGVDPASFWYTESVAHVRKYASEELLAWFDECGRATWKALHESIIDGGHFIAHRTSEGLLR